LSTSLQPTYGKIYQNFSLKWVFVFVVSTFEIGSLICGVAPNSVVFIVGRAIAGLGAGGIFAGALTIIAYSIPLAKRPIFTGCIGAMFGVI
jgi:MFS family permease